MARLTLIVCLLAGSHLFAQEYRFRQYRVEQGLPSDVIKAVSQDSLGFIWIATDDGLVKYDGLHFTTYKSALRSQYSKGFLKTRDGRLLAVGDLDLVEIQNLIDTVIFKTLIRGTRSPTDSTLWYGKALYEDRAGNIWIAEPQSVLKYDGHAIDRFDFGTKNRSPVFIRSYSFFEDDAGQLYTAAYDGKVYRYEPDRHRFVQLQARLPANTSHTLFYNGKLWATATDGLYTASLVAGQLEGLQKIMPLYAGSFMLRTAPDDLWVSTFGEDVYKVRQGQQVSLETLLYNFNGVNNLYATAEGDLWISTDKGVVLVQRNQFTIADANSQTHFIEGIAHDPARDILYYCYKETLVELRRSPFGEWTSHTLYDNRDSYFQSLQFSKKNGLWASTAFDVLLFQNGKQKAQWNFESEGNFVHDLFLDSRGNLWLSQARNSSVKKITDSLTLQHYDVPANPQGEINLVREGPRGIYAASRGKAGYLFLKANDSETFQNVSLPIHFSVVGDLNIHDMAIQGDVVWMATTEGLLRYDHNTVERVNLGQTMTNFSVSSVEVLDANNILFSNSFGLLRYNTVTGDFWLYDENTGLPSNTVTDHGIMIDAAGRLWVGTSYGLSIATHSIIGDKATTRPYCVNALVNGISRRFMKGLTAPYGSFINLEYSPITFPENKIDLQWRMDGDTVWQSLKNHELNLSGLKAGDHRVYVRAKKNTGLSWSEPTITGLHVEKPYWQKARFIAGILLAAMFIAWVSVAISARIMKKRREYLQALVAERTRDLQKANEELLLRNTELDRFVYSASHDLSAPLKSILGLIMVARLDHSVESHEQYLGMMERSVRKLEEFIEEVVSYSRNTRMPIRLETFSFVPFVQNLLLDHQYSPNYSKISFLVEDHTHNTMVGDVTRLKIILNNLISNAIKFHWVDPSRSPFVKISLSNSAARYKITVEDNGLGIEAKHLDHIFDMFYRASEQAQGSGLGLYILKESVVRLDGTVEAHSKVHEGTTFTIVLPVPGAP